MGCFNSKNNNSDNHIQLNSNVSLSNTTNKPNSKLKNFHKLKWKASNPNLTKIDYDNLRAEFWDTCYHYSGKKQTWEAIKQICESEDMNTAQRIMTENKLITHDNNGDIFNHGCYDQSGVHYKIPKYCFKYPIDVNSKSKTDSLKHKTSNTSEKEPLNNSKVMVLFRFNDGTDHKTEIGPNLKFKEIAKLLNSQNSNFNQNTMKFIYMGRMIDKNTRLDDIIKSSNTLNSNNINNCEINNTNYINTNNSENNSNENSSNIPVIVLQVFNSK